MIASSAIGRSTKRRPLDASAIPDVAARHLRWFAGAWTVAATAGFAIGALRNGIPRSPDSESWEEPVQVVLLAVVALGGLITWRFEGIGAAVITLGAVGLGVLAAIEHPPLTALFVALAFYAPGLLFWLAWQRTKPMRAIVALALIMLLVLSAGGVAASRVYDSFFGPTHPASTTLAPPASLVEWIWSGAVTERSALVTARLSRDGAAVRLLVSERGDLAAPIVVESAASAGAGNDRIVSFAVDGLRPDTPYFYAVEADGELDRSRQGHFRTFASGASSFTFAFGGCAEQGSNGAVFDAIRQLDPSFFLIAGDFYYANIVANDPAAFRAALGDTLTSPAQALLYRSVPAAYVWDDHDYGSNNADGTSPSREAAQRVYREAVPHYPLPAGDGSAPIYQAFSVGRVRFILTDTRSARTPTSAADDANKSMLGAEQKAWFKRELLAAAGQYPVIVWVNADPWIDTAEAGADTWAGYATERQELADFIVQHRIQGLVMLSGDAHMVAIDDGSHSGYATGGGGGFPVMHAAALDRRGSIKGGPYSEGAYPGGGQFGLMTVVDDGGQMVEIIWSGRDWTGAEIVRYTFSLPAVPVAAEAAATT
jgi:phosphodiesterase/alkaline phosphatase D-like protein